MGTQRQTISKQIMFNFSNTLSNGNRKGKFTGESMSRKLEWMRTNLFHPVKSAPSKCRSNLRQHNFLLVTFADIQWSVPDYVNTIKFIFMHFINLVFLIIQQEKLYLLQPLWVWTSQSRIIHLKCSCPFSLWLSWWLMCIAIFLQYMICHSQATVLTSSQKRKWALLWPFMTEKCNPIRYHSCQHHLLQNQL